MTVFQSIILGIVQGLTEFLPISSSGHLVLVPAFLHWHIAADEAFVFNVLIQMATLVGVIIYFWTDLYRIIKSFLKSLFQKASWQAEDTRLGWLIIIATLPAGILGLFLNDIFENAFASPKLVGIFLIITAIMLFIAERISKRNRSLSQLNWLDALIMGLFQGFALFPGVSRSGSTICGGMVRHLHRKDAAKFSFLMSIPIMLAAGLLEFIKLLQMPHVKELLPVFIPGFIAAAISGYIAIHLLLEFLGKHRLDWFSVYLIAVGVLVIITPLY